MYDANGDVIGEQDANGAFTSYALNKSGNIVSITDALGYRTDVVYNKDYRPRGG